MVGLWCDLGFLWERRNYLARLDQEHLAIEAWKAAAYCYYSYLQLTGSLPDIVLGKGLFGVSKQPIPMDSGA